MFAGYWLLYGVTGFASGEFNTKTKPLIARLVLVSAPSQLSDGRLGKVPADIVGGATNTSFEQRVPAEKAPFVAPLPIFFPVGELDETPHPIDQLPEDLASFSKELSEGSLTLQIWLSHSGHVLRTQVMRSSFSESVSDAIANQIVKTPFLPGMRNGVPVNTLLEFEIGSRLEGESSRFSNP